jgi:hypothetical protein
MSVWAEFLGQLIGTALGHTLRIAGPVCVQAMMEALKNAMQDTTETGAPNPGDVHQHAFDDYDRMRDAAHSSAAGNGCHDAAAK